MTEQAGSAGSTTPSGDWPKPRGVILDKDGTLFHFAASWNAWTVRVIGLLAGGDDAQSARIAARLQFDLGRGCFHDDSPVIAGTLAEIAELLAPVIPDRDAAALEAFLEAEAATARMVPATDLDAFCQAMEDRGIALGLATNDSEAAARAHLDRAGILHRFAFVAGYDSGHGAKPGPGPLLAGAKALGLDPGQVLMVGDSPHDMAAGHAAGMRTVAVLTGPARAPELGPHAHRVLDDIGALAGWIDSLG